MIDKPHIVSEVLQALRDCTNSGDQYLQQIGDPEMINPFLKDAPPCSRGMSHAIPTAVLAELGIRSVTLSKLHDSFALPREVLPASTDAGQYKWHSFRNASFLTNLKSVLHDCQVIAFSDWAGVEGASQLWDGLLSDVIKPLKRKDLNFLFYLGDPTEKRWHEVDEIVDIISSFSHHGKVTFLLNEQEAIKLWMVLHGKDPEEAAVYTSTPDLIEKYRAIFNTMRVERLLIYSIDRAILLSSQQHFDLHGPVMAPHPISQDMKDNFNAGYSLGLLLQLDVPHCIALGMAVSGVYAETGTSPDRQAVLVYLERWLDELIATENELVV